MGPPRRVIIVSIITFLLILLLFHRSSKDTWRDHVHHITTGAARQVGLGETIEEWLSKPPKVYRIDGNTTIIDAWSPTTSSSNPLDSNWKTHLVPGSPKPPGSDYTRALIIPKTKKEDISWMDEHLPESYIPRVVYVADDPYSPRHPPANKGHEAMVYLTYIIENYDSLPEIMLFMHAHQKTWHNNDVFGSDAAEMVKQLSSERVVREGYMNLRCQWYPGCPDWMHPGNTEFDIQKTEQVLIAKAWAEIFPFDPVPDVLAQPCCSQFALSRERVHSIPKAQFEFYRTWILTTPLQDALSGRVWEYMWQYAFTGKNYVCPAEHVCYCDGYGACFGGAEKYKEWDEKKKERDKFNMKLLRWQQMRKQLDELEEKGETEKIEAFENKPEPGKDLEYWGVIQARQKEMDEMGKVAMERGQDPKIRAEESGREYHEGDGY